ncbi:hypothetical protein [Chitinimonas lacunae]|uniref:Transposase n=1 Tax=Chitinimonas lacunae TaxID=1963018 RepID=A0ABV8MRI4_9NEIS
MLIVLATEGRSRRIAGFEAENKKNGKLFAIFHVHKTWKCKIRGAILPDRAGYRNNRPAEALRRVIHGAHALFKYCAIYPQDTWRHMKEK